MKRTVLVLLLALIAVLPIAAQSTDSSLPALELARVFPDLTFERPVFLTHAGNEDGFLYIVEQEGVVHRIGPGEAGRADVFLDIRPRVSRRGNEEGLLGLAFSPTFEENGRFYVYYSATKPRRSILSVFEVDANGLANTGSEAVVLEVAQPFPNHNGGMITFGPDGMLYVGLGDGGSAGDPHGNGQDPGTLLGAILRIDPEQPARDATYAIPPDNPFVGVSGARDEVWAYGLRNPWRFSFDRSTGDLWAGDVGQNAREEVNIVYPGVNYGWNVMEGSLCFRARTCDQSDLQAPVVEYGRNSGCSITGGYVYRGQRLPELEGVYLYADFCSGRVWGLRYDGAAVTAQAELVEAPFEISSFGEDTDGEVYVLGFDGGIYTFALAPSDRQPLATPTPSPRRETVPHSTSPAPTPTKAPTVNPVPTPTRDSVVRPAPTPTVTQTGQEPSTYGYGWWWAAIAAGLAGAAIGLIYLVLRHRNTSR